MAVLAHCWFIIECYLIPDGFTKWFFLSFYINPLFLFFCQIFLWVKTLKRWIFLIIFLLNHFVFSRVLGFLRHFLIIPRSSYASVFAFNDCNTYAQDDDDTWYEVPDSFSTSETTSGILFLHYESSCEIPKMAFCDVYFELVDQETVSVHSSSDLDNSCASSLVSSCSFGTREDIEVISSTRSSTCTLLEDHEAASNDAAEYGLITGENV